MAILGVRNLPKRKLTSINLVILKKTVHVFILFFLLDVFFLSMNGIRITSFFPVIQFAIRYMWQINFSKVDFYIKMELKNMFKKALCHEKRNSHDTCCLILGGH